MSRQAIDAGHERFLAAMRANDPTALLRELTDDVRFMPPNQSPLQGKAAVRTWYDQFVGQMRTSSLTITDREVLIVVVDDHVARRDVAVEQAVGVEDLSVDDWRRLFGDAAHQLTLENTP